METRYLLLLASAALLIILNSAIACNEAVCASVVSKCMLTQSCKCDLKNCSCCKECFNCLGNLYDECCSCVDMCPKRKDDDSLSTKSHVENFQEPFPELFRQLTVEADPIGRWQVYTMRNTIDEDNYLHKQEKHLKLHNHNEQEVDPQKAMNCTVAYLPQCMPWKKCRQSCLSMGASKYRWFHDGCCECVGENCMGYGSDQSLCTECPQSKTDGQSEDDTSSNFYYDDESEYNMGDAVKQQAAEAASI